MQRDTIVIYHGNCPDGFGAALAAWLVLGDSAHYLPYQYDMAPPDVKGKTVFVLDFSFDKEMTLRLNEECHRFVLLDHHKTAVQNLAGIKAKEGNLIVLDLEKSGARLAWEFFLPETDVPELIALIEDRDLWRWKFQDLSRAYLAKLDTLPKDFVVWNEVLNQSRSARLAFLEEGEQLLQAHKAHVQSIVDRAQPVQLLSETGWMVQAARELADDVGQELAKREGTFGLIWREEQADTLSVSLRSATGYDVRALAEKFGGGGHPRSAAFRIPAERLNELSQGNLTP